MFNLWQKPLGSSLLCKIALLRINVNYVYCYYNVSTLIAIYLHTVIGGEDRFEVDPETGVVRTKGRTPFRLGKEYEIGVSVEDINAPTLQKSMTYSLKILVGERNPQFYETQYKASVPETAPEGFE